MSASRTMQLVVSNSTARRTIRSLLLWIWVMRPPGGLITQIHSSSERIVLLAVLFETTNCIVRDADIPVLGVASTSLHEVFQGLDPLEERQKLSHGPITSCLR